MKRSKKVTALLITVLAVLVTAFAGKKAHAGGQSDQADNIVIDLSGGYWEQTEGDFMARLGLKDGAALADFLCKRTGAERKDTARQAYIDWDKDGTWDFTIFTGDTEYAYYGTVIVPTSECSVSGDLTVERAVGDSFLTMTFRFGTNPGRAKFNITAENCRIVDSAGYTVTSAAPGERLFLIADKMEGRYVKSWTDGSGREYRRFICADPERVMVIMPCADIELKAAVEEQTPLRVDLTEGFWEIGEPLVDPNTILVGNRLFSQETKYNNFFTSRFTVQTGGGDICFGYKYRHNYDLINQQSRTAAFFIPAANLKMTGEYELRDLNSGAYWPIIFIFPDSPVQETYKILVENGTAFDNKIGKEVTEAAPGTVLRIQYNERTDGYSDKDHTWDYSDISNSDWDFIVMPAHDIWFMPASQLDKQTVLERNDSDVYKLNFKLNGSRYECPVPESDTEAWALYFPEYLGTFANEYERFGIKYENGLFIMNAKDDRGLYGPDPVQGYFEDDLGFGENTYCAIEFRFGEPVTLYPISEGNVVSLYGRIPLRATYAGQEVLILADEKADYVLINDVKYIPVNGIVEYAAPKGPITVIEHFEEEDVPTVTPEPTDTPTVTPEYTPSPIPTAVPDQPGTADAAEKKTGLKKGVDAVTILLIAVILLVLTVFLLIIRRNLKLAKKRKEQ
ncbi:MAG: hypothetical protein J5643_05330 [Lachnospiraceae bacterium]|nr:hypothetical protein [Lachnospiraceae bacterium]